jgi:hypothetical protein
LVKLNFDVLEYFFNYEFTNKIRIVTDELCYLKCKLENWHINCLKGIIFITAGERSVAGGGKNPTVLLPERQNFKSYKLLSTSPAFQAEMCVVF